MDNLMQSLEDALAAARTQYRAATTTKEITAAYMRLVEAEAALEAKRTRDAVDDSTNRIANRSTKSA
jgi:hypothetical protein